MAKQRFGIMRNIDQDTIDAINLDNTREAILRNLNLDPQGIIRTFDIPQQMASPRSLGAEDIETLQEEGEEKKTFGDIIKTLGMSDFNAMSGIPVLGQGLQFLSDQFQYRGADPSITGTPFAQFAFRNQLRRNPDFDIAAALDRQNALGGYYSDFARTQRQFANRFSNMIDRARSGKPFSERNLMGISRALGQNLTQNDINNIVSGAYDLNTGTGASGAGTFTAQSLSDSFAGEEGPVGGGTGTMSASDFSDDSPGTPF